ncbi:MAG TPA: serine/threonine-protein kinase [Polyangiaceae bacterium]|jgi:serine/threonine-protein kinase|nr:serine/threonine-protein kinase [Polyangiaceae bacterium]
MVLEPGFMLGRYRVDNQLGAGGMGEVYRAWDDVLHRWIALKVVPRSDARSKRLVGEARAVAALQHPNIVGVHDVGEDGDWAFVSMDLVEGQTLRDWIGIESISFETQLAWLVQIASALRAAHKAGIVHRDVKPDNVMISKDGEARVLDFGLAKALTSFEGVDVGAPTEHGADTFRTQEGRVSGTPAYMAPEQLAGGPASPAWDQYAWGVLACELLTGKHPRIAGLIAVSGRVKPESLAHVPPAVADVVSRAMAPVADERFASMDAILAALGAPASSPVIAKGVSLPPPKKAESNATASGMAIGDTLQVPIHPNAPAPQTKSRRALWLGALAVLVIVGGGVTWKLRSPTTVASTMTTATATATPIPIASAAPSETVSATPIVSTAPSASAITIATTTKTSAITPAAPRKLDVRIQGHPSPQYDEAAVNRGLSGGKFGIKSCVEQNPPQTLPDTFTITLELWDIADEHGKVRDVRSREPAALSKCLHEALEGLEFGPSKPGFAPGTVFISVNVDRL